MPFSCQPVEADFLDTAPFCFFNQVELDATPAEVFAMFGDAEAWPQWFDEIRHVEWTSERPFGPGTTRIVTLNTMKVYEHFFRWEEGRRLTFYFTGTGLPFARSFAEDYLLEEKDGKTVFSWKVAWKPNLLLWFAWPIGKWMLGRMFRRASQSLVKYVAEKKG